MIHPTPPAPSSGAFRSPLGCASAACLGALAASAMLAALAGGLVGVASQEPRDTLHGSLAEIASIAAHNAGVALVPLALAALGWDELRGLTLAGDAVVAGILVANGVAIGLALAAVGPGLSVWLPHLPFEWAAIAVPAGAWFAFRARPPQARARALAYLAALTGLLLLLAAAVESYAVPVL